MPGLLYIASLSVSCSYRRNVERAVKYPLDVPDTVQWWLPETQPPVWRVRTFALDHDVHTVTISGVGFSNALAFAKNNTRRHFGDVITSEHEIIVSAFDNTSIREAFELEGLTPRYQIYGEDYLFWKPDDERYYSQSAPDFAGQEDDPPVLLGD